MSAGPGLRLALGTLSVIPVRVTRVDQVVAGWAMRLAPVVGLLLAGLAVGVQSAALGAGTGPLLAASLAVGALAVVTRGLHLDGLADVADGLGSNKPAPDALRIMKQSDIGPFGVLTLLLVLLIDVAALAQALAHGYAYGAVALVVAVTTGRTAITLGCTGKSARPGGLGAMVAGTVGRTGFLLLAALALGAALVAGFAVGDPVRPALAVVAGLGAAAALLWHTTRRFGGMTGDVLGALNETATATALVVLATH